MAKYSKRAGEKVEEVMREKKRGTLRSSSGRKVTSRKQAIAIGLSEARREGAKVPKKKSAAKKKAAPKKRTASKKKAAKKSTGAKRSPSKRSGTPRRVGGRKSARKSTTRRSR